MLSGILLQIFYGILGSWTAYLISVLYVEYRTRKEKENVNFKNHVIQVCLFLFSSYKPLISRSWFFATFTYKRHNLMTLILKFQWFEVLDGLLGPFWKALGLAFNCTFLLFGSVIQLIACARLVHLFLHSFNKFVNTRNMISLIFYYNNFDD